MIMNTPQFLKKFPIPVQFLRFMLVGISGTLIDTGILMGLTHLGWQTLPANVVSYSAGLINNYFWNSRWTFNSADRRYDLEQFCQFAIISLIGLGLNSLIVIGLQPNFTQYEIFKAGC